MYVLPLSVMANKEGSLVSAKTAVTRFQPGGDTARSTERRGISEDRSFDVSADRRDLSARTATSATNRWSISVADSTKLIGRVSRVSE